MIGAVSRGATANAWKHFLADEGAQANHVRICVVFPLECYAGWISKGVHVEPDACEYSIPIRIFMATCTTFGLEDVSTGPGIAREGCTRGAGGTDRSRASARAA